MGDLRFERARRLVEYLGRSRSGNSDDLRASLRLGHTFSLWDVVTTYLLMYRFPRLFAPDGTAASPQMETRLRPWRGIAARVYDRVSRVPRTDTACGRWPGPAGTVLFTGFVDSFYRDVLRPVAERMADSGRPIVVFRDHAATPVADPTPLIGMHSVWDHWDADAYGMANTMLQRLGGESHGMAWRSFDWAVDVARQFDGVSVRPDLQWLFWREFARLVPYVAVAAHVMTRHRPRLLVSADDADPRCRIFALTARSAGIPSLLVQQGLSRRDVPEFAFLTHDRIAAMGQISRDEMIEQGVPRDRIEVTGPPGFDEMAAERGDNSAVRREFGLLDGDRLVVMASQPPVVGAFANPASRREMIAAVSRVAITLPGTTLVIKPHPGEHMSELLELAGGVPNVRIVERSRSIAPLIHACDVFLTFFSTSAIQAMYAGKPVINLDFGADEGVRTFADSRATWVARSSAELSTHLIALTSGLAPDASEKAAAARRFLESTVYRTDGRATERVVDFAEQILARAGTATCN